jgi:hypothetical protein
MNPTIYVFWTGHNEMSNNRQRCLKHLQNVSGVNIQLVTPDNLGEFILEEAPLHPAYPYLSETHKADYLRTYFMHFIGGGYSDVKETTGNWTHCFEELYQSDDKWINGYKEVEGGVAYKPAEHAWRELIGNCSYICKPRTPFTQEWYDGMIAVLDEKLEQLRQFPSTHPQDCAQLNGGGGGYPIEWNELLGRIFHRICFKYKEHILNTVPPCTFHHYR